MRRSLEKAQPVISNSAIGAVTAGVVFALSTGPVVGVIAAVGGAIVGAFGKTIAEYLSHSGDKK